MKRLTLLFLICLCPILVKSQKSDTTYYKDHRFSKKTKKGKFAKINVKDGEGSFTSYYKVNGWELVRKNSSIGEQMGIWYFDGKPVLDYDFELITGKNDCSSIVDIDNKTLLALQDDGTKNYAAPVLNSTINKTDDPYYLRKHLQRSFRIPRDLRRKGSGEWSTIIVFKINTSGVVTDVKVRESSGEISLDKEAMRVVRALKFDSPAKVNDKPVELCLETPLVVKIM